MSAKIYLNLLNILSFDMIINIDIASIYKSETSTLILEYRAMENMFSIEVGRDIFEYFIDINKKYTLFENKKYNSKDISELKRNFNHFKMTEYKKQKWYYFGKCTKEPIKLDKGQKPILYK